MTRTHLDSRPAPDFWLGELRLEHFTDRLDLLGRPDALQVRLRDEYAGPSASQTLRTVLEEEGDTPEVRLHLLLVAEFLHRKNMAVIRAVAEKGLPADVIGSLAKGSDRIDRLAAATALYRDDPYHLVAIDAWHRWNRPRRCATRLDVRRGLPVPWEEIPWDELVTEALRQLRAEHLSLRGPFARDRQRDVLLALRESSRRTTMRDDAGHVLPGRRDDWTLLRFFDDGYRVDITARRLSRAIRIASAVASALWGRPLAYAQAKDPLTRKRLDLFLARLTDPHDDTFELLEITAGIPGRWGTPLHTISKPGQMRVEHNVAEMRETYCFAEDSRTVHRVKVGFEGRYRIQLHFPLPDDADLELAYDDLGRDKDMASRFEALVARAMGVKVHPKVATGARRKRREPPTRPRRMKTAHVAAMLGPILDDPAPWQRDYVDKLVKQGVVMTTDHTVFRCGDPAIQRRFQPEITLDCPGLVVMPFHRRKKDPFDQDPEASFECSACGTLWELGTFRPPAFHRILIDLAPAGAWKHLLRLLSAKLKMQPEKEGVASRSRRGDWEYVVFVPLAEDSWNDPLRAHFQPLCWIVADRDDAQVYGNQAVALADVLAQGPRVVARVLDRARQAPRKARGQGVLIHPTQPYHRERRRSNRGPTAPFGAAVRDGPLPDLDLRIIQPGDEGLYLDHVRFASARQDRIHLLFAMLQRITNREGVSPRKRAFHTAAELAELDLEGRIEVHHVQQWIYRARRLLDEAFPAEDGIGARVLEGRRQTGTRLGPGFECRKFDLDSELERHGSKKHRT